MKTVEACLSVSLLLHLAVSLPAQAPPSPPGQPDKKLPRLVSAEPLKADVKDDELRKLLIARHNAALEEVQGNLQLYSHSRVSLETFIDSMQRLVHARLELTDKPADKIVLLTQYVELSEVVEKIAQTHKEAGKTLFVDVHRAHYHRLNAEIQLLRAKRDADKAKEK